MYDKYEKYNEVSMIDTFKFWGAVTVGTKGQVVIPADARETFDIHEGDKILVLSPPGKASLIMVKPEILNQFMRSMQSDVEGMISAYDKHEEK